MRRADQGWILIWGALWCAGCGTSTATPPVSPTTKSAAATPAVSEEQRATVRKFCGDCHEYPRADYFPQVAWSEEVKRGFEFYDRSGRTDLEPPPRQLVVNVFHAEAPETLELPVSSESVETTQSLFQKQVRQQAGPQDALPGCSIANVAYLKWDAAAPAAIVTSDMMRGEVRAFSPGETGAGKLWAKIPNPAHTTTCDLDGDGVLELIVADLGSKLPEDHQLGSVVWLKPTGTDWRPHTLLKGVGRVADVEPVDLDGDGDQDLLVAEFGWHATGGIHWLENRGIDAGVPQFERHTLDRRPGTIHVIPADLNKDGQPDFVALISQEHEAVVAFLNVGAGKFETQELGPPQDPAFGSSGIQLVDFDADGDLDVLYTNGDTFDSFFLKPYHGIQWLENRGSFPFEAHRLADLPGVHRAHAADLDGDGDLDIAAAALVPQMLMANESSQQLDSLIWLEQAGLGEFRRHVLERGVCRHATLDVADIDDDGDLDLLVGNFHDEHAPFSLWRNVSKNGPAGDETR